MMQTLRAAVRTLILIAALAIVAKPLLAGCSQNQDQDQKQSQDQNNDSTQKPAGKDKGIDPRSNPPPPDQPRSPEPAPIKAPDDPGKVAYLAQKDIEVGTFYLHKGDTAAAIDRFHHATETRPTLSKPWELLGEAYEKMDDKEEALKCYQQYLKIQPGAADAKKVQKKIAKLQSDLK
jgi:tetratricopeptide (TPR) repeat protein